MTSQQWNELARLHYNDRTDICEVLYDWTTHLLRVRYIDAGGVTHYDIINQDGAWSCYDDVYEWRARV